MQQPEKKRRARKVKEPVQPKEVETKKKRAPNSFAKYIKEHGTSSVVDGVDYKGKPKDKMKALGTKWKSLSQETKDKYKNR